MSEALDDRFPHAFGAACHEGALAREFGLGGTAHLSNSISRLTVQMSRVRGTRERAKDVGSIWMLASVWELCRYRQCVVTTHQVASMNLPKFRAGRDSCFRRSMFPDPGD